MNLLRVIVMCLAGAFALDSDSSFGNTPPGSYQPTLAQVVAAYHHVVLAKKVDSTDSADGKQASTTFKVIDVAKSKGDAFKSGDLIKTSPSNASEDQFCLLLSEKVRDDWYVAGAIPDVYWRYLKKVPPPATDVSQVPKRAIHFFAYLDHKNREIADDAARELNTLPNHLLKQVAALLPVEELRKRATDIAASPYNYVVYALLLGLAGEPDKDGPTLKRIAFDLKSVDESRHGIEKVMAAWVLLCGDQALGHLEEVRIRSTSFLDSDGTKKQLPFSERYAAMEALIHVWNCETKIVSKDRLKQAMRGFLVQPDTADFAIGRLTLWQDWSLQQRVMGMYNSQRFDFPSVKRSIIRYIYACSRNLDPDSQDAASAQENLRILKSRDPKIYRFVMRFLVPPE